MKNCHVVTDLALRSIAVAQHRKKLEIEISVCHNHEKISQSDSIEKWNKQVMIFKAKKNYEEKNKRSFEHFVKYIVHVYTHARAGK